MFSPADISQSPRLKAHANERNIVVPNMLRPLYGTTAVLALVDTRQAAQALNLSLRTELQDLVLEVQIVWENIRTSCKIKICWFKQQQ